MLTALVTGAGGQLGKALAESTPKDIELISVDRSQLDISDMSAVREMYDNTAPDIVINAAAYTAVDKAEDEESLAYAINEQGPKNLAEASLTNTFMLHVSTDFVFDGSKSSPYGPEDTTNPVSVYGASKLAGEKAVLAAKPQNAAVVRTSWVYGAEGNNFLKSMLRLMSERDELGIVVDQVGTPTSVRGLAEVCWQAAIEKVSGIYHWSDAGVASWYDFAEAIMQEAVARGVLSKPISLHPIRSASYPTKAKRPSYSVLDKDALLKALPNIENIHWQKQLATVFDQIQLQRV